MIDILLSLFSYSYSAACAWLCANHVYRFDINQICQQQQQQTSVGIKTKACGGDREYTRGYSRSDVDGKRRCIAFTRTCAKWIIQSIEFEIVCFLYVICIAVAVAAATKWNDLNISSRNVVFRARRFSMFIKDNNAGIGNTRMTSV